MSKSRTSGGGEHMTSKQHASIRQRPVRPHPAQAYEEVEYLDNAGRLIATERVPAHSSRAGHDAELYPEDQAYLTAPSTPVVYDDIPRQRSSAIRYTTTQRQEVIHSPHRRFVIH